MAGQIPFISGTSYHIYNRGVRKSDIFFIDKDYQRWEELLYWCCNYNYSYSNYLIRLHQARKKRKDPRSIIQDLNQNYRFNTPPVEIIAYVHMPNHYHLLVKQVRENGISRFIHRVATAYAKYINEKHKMSGSLYQGPMQAIMIRSKQQMVNVARYIHINPVSAGLAAIKNLVDYPWSSFPAYIKEDGNKILTKKYLLDYFDNNVKKFIKFTQESLADARDLEGLTIDDDYGWFVNN